MLLEKAFNGAKECEVTEEMRVTIAGQAAVMLLGIDDYYFDGVRTIVVHPGSSLPARLAGFDGDDDTEDNELLGQLWHRGPIVLAWQQVLRAGRNQSGGMNVVFHEFAHFLDGLDGHVDGIPNLPGSVQNRWYRVTEAEFLRLVGQAERGEATLLDHYGATNLTEFFAVATECFFERPRAMKAQHSELYQLLQRFYRQDPAEWLVDHAPLERSPRRRRRECSSRLPIESPDDLFARGFDNLQRGEYEQAIDDFTHVLDRTPDDAEALMYRAMAGYSLHEVDAAWADCNAALAQDETLALAWSTRGSILLDRHDVSGAIESLDRAIEHDDQDADSYFLRGLAYLNQHDAPRAVRDLQQALALEPYDAETHYRLAEALTLLGQHAEAQLARERSQNLDPQLYDRLQDGRPER